MKATSRGVFFLIPVSVEGRPLRGMFCHTCWWHNHFHECHAFWSMIISTLACVWKCYRPNTKMYSVLFRSCRVTVQTRPQKGWHLKLTEIHKLKWKFKLTRTLSTVSERFLNYLYDLSLICQRSFSDLYGHTVYIKFWARLKQDLQGLEGKQPFDARMDVSMSFQQSSWSIKGILAISPWTGYFRNISSPMIVSLVDSLSLNSLSWSAKSVC